MTWAACDPPTVLRAERPVAQASFTGSVIARRDPAIAPQALAIDLDGLALGRGCSVRQPPAPLSRRRRDADDQTEQRFLLGPDSSHSNRPSSSWRYPRKLAAAAQNRAPGAAGRSCRRRTQALFVVRPRAPDRTFLSSRRICTNCFNRRLTSSTEVPAPRADAFPPAAVHERSGLRRSSVSVIELMMAVRLVTMRRVSLRARPPASAPIPGSRPSN